MTKVRLLALLAVVALVLFPAIAFAQGSSLPPQLPCAFHGTVMVNGQNVTDGTIISVKIGNDTPYTTTTKNSTYSIVIAQPAGEDYTVMGLTVTFMIGSDTASQTGTWQGGSNVELNLTKGTPGTTPPPGGTCCITTAQLGNTTGVSGNTLTIDKGAITGAPGKDGTNGTNGAPGKDGKNASSVLGIVAIILAIIAIIAAVVVMMRKPREIYSTGPKGDAGYTGPKGDKGDTGRDAR